MQNQQGSSQVEYIIPLALVGVVIGLSMFYMFSEGNILKYFSSSSRMEVDQSAKKIVLGASNNLGLSLVSDKVESENKDLKEDDSGSADDKESLVKTCSEGMCTIDFGGIVLAGIPEDFNEFTEVAGSSGSTDLLASLISQIAKQLEEEGKIEEAREIKQLANLGHNLAVLENYAESVVSSCNENSSCVKDKLNLPMTKPENYNEDLSPFPENITYDKLSQSLFDIGRARNYKANNIDEYNSNLSDDRLAYMFVDKYDSIADNPSISDSVKGLLKELYRDIGVISEDFDNNLSSLFCEGSSDYYDPITGERSSSGSTSDPFSDFESYSASKITHFDSSLICASANNKDSGIKCH